MKRKVPNVIGVSIKEAREILEKVDVEIEKEKKKIDIFEKSGKVVKVEPREETELKKNEKVVLYVSDRKPVFIIVFLILLCVLFGRTSLGRTIIRGTEDKVIRVLNLSKPTAPEITGGSKEWSQSQVVKVKKDSYAKKGLAYYEYCVGTNLNKCVWKKTNTKNVRVSKTGKWKVVFRGVDKAGNTSSNSNIEEVYVDNNNPVINKVSFKNKKVKIEATDKESGIKKYYYSIDGKNYKETKKEFEITEETEKIYIRVEDKAGNKTTVEVPLEKENESTTTKTTKKTTTTTTEVTNPETPTTVPSEEETTTTTSTTTTKKGMVYDIPKINLDKVPVEFVYGSDYELPSYVDFGNDEGTYQCVVEGKEETTTKNLGIGKHLIVCEATSSHNKRTMVEKEVEVLVKSGEEEIWDGWIRLNLSYPDNSTNWEWRIGKEGEIRDGYDYTGWQDYTGPILVKLDDVKDVYIRYDLLGQTYIIAPNGKVAVDIEPGKYALEENEKATVKIVYERNLETKEYRVAGGEWEEYTGEFEVGKNTLIEARGIRNEKVYDSDGNYLYTKKVTGTDSVFIGEVNATKGGTANGGNKETFEYEVVERPNGSHTTKPKGDTQPSTYLEGPEITVDPTDLVESVSVKVTPQEKASKIYIKIGNGNYQEYTEEVSVSKNVLVKAYYIREEDGKTSETSNYYIQNIKKANKPYVRIDATPDYLNEEVDKVTVKISGSNYTKLEYSLDGIIYEEYKGELIIEQSQTIYAKGTNENGETIESLDITTMTSPKVKDNIEISIKVDPSKEEVEGLINKAKVKITYEKKATKKYYKLGYYDDWKEYTGEFEITENETIYAYATGDNAVGKARKSVGYLTTGIASPIITVEPTGKSQQVKVSIEYASTAEITRYKLGNGEYRDYNGSFYVYENETVYAYNKDELGNASTSEYKITNIVSAPNYVAIDKGKYYIIKLNYPETSNNQEYKWKSDGEWKSYNGYGILLIKPEYKEEFSDIKDGIKVKDEYGKEIIFTDHYYFIDVPFSELMENLFMRWDTSKISAPKIIETPEEVTREASISIVYNKSLVKKLYKIVYEDGEETEWLEYEKPFKIDKNKATIYAKGITRNESESKVGSITITNIDDTDSEIKLKGNFVKAARQINVTVNAEDEFGIDKVKWATGEQTKEYFKKNGNGIRNGSSFKIEENGKYTIYAVDYVGNEVIKVIDITNIDKEAPDIKINILTESYGTEAEIEIEYGDSAKKEYKIGQNGSYKDYTGKIKITSNEVLNLVNEDGNLTIYAKGTDEAGNASEISEDIYILDLDAPKEPIIYASSGYPILTEYGVKLNSKSYIVYDDTRDDIINYYSIDNGATWKVYTGPFDITSGTIMAKSVKKVSGLTITATKNIDMPKDALGFNAYDEDETTYINTSTTKQYIYIDSNMVGKYAYIKISATSAYRNFPTTVAFMDKNDKILSSYSAYTDGYSNEQFYTGAVLIPDGAVKIAAYDSSANGKIYEIMTYSTPVINEQKYYPRLTEYGAKSGYSEITINYFQTSIKRLYRINGGEWQNYDDKSIKLEPGNKLEAKGIDKNGKETLVSNCTVTLIKDALGFNAYDEDDTTSLNASTTKQYIDVDSNMIGKYVYIKISATSAYRNYSTTVAFIDKNEKILSSYSAYTDGYSNEQFYTGTVLVPDGTVKIAAYHSSANGKIYEIMTYSTPTLNKQSRYPKLTEYGINVGYNDVTINYFNTSIRRLYRINNGEWQDYDDKLISLKLGDKLEAKGIDKNGKETLVLSYNSTLSTSAIGPEAYDGDSNTSYLLSKNNNYANVQKYMDVGAEMIGQTFSIDAKGNTSYATLNLYFYDSNNTVLKKTAVFTNSYTRVTKKFVIPDNTVKLGLEIASSYTYEKADIYEITVYTNPNIKINKIYPKLTEYGVKSGYNDVTINYFQTGIQRLYRINAGEWQNYEDKPVSLKLGDKLEAKGIDKNGKETPVSSYTSALPTDAIGSEAYDGDSNTSYLLSKNNNYANVQKYMDVSTEMIGQMFSVDAKGNTSHATLNLYFYDSNNTVLKKTAVFTNSYTRVTKKFVIPNNTVKLGLEIASSYTSEKADIYEISQSTSPIINEIKYYPTLSNDSFVDTYSKISVKYLSYFAKKLYSLDNGTTWLDYTNSFEAAIGTKVLAKAIDSDGTETAVSSYTVVGLSDNISKEVFDNDESTSTKIAKNTTKSFSLNNVAGRTLRIYTTGTVNAGAYIKFYNSSNNELETITLTTDLTTLVIPEGSVKASIYSGASTLTINEINLREIKSTKEEYPEININSTNWTTTKTIEILYPEGTEREYSLDLGATWNKYVNELTIDKETTIFARSIKDGKIISTNSFVIAKVDNVDPAIELDIPEEVTQNDSYNLPTKTTYGNSGGTVVCKVNDKEVKNTTELDYGENTITCLATSGSGKTTEVSKTLSLIKVNSLKDTLMNREIITAEPTLTTSSNNTNDASGLYKSINTNDATSTYYFRGDVKDNYVSFAGQIWRIVRINEDGTIRLIMQNGINNDQAYVFNSNYSDYSYMYYSNSEAKTILENWYNTSIGNNENYSKHVASGSYYCEQAKVKFSSAWTSGSATMEEYTNYTPTFKCETDGNGKGIVTSNIGLLTYDELILAGGYFNEQNDSYYLYNQKFSWLMTPSGIGETYIGIWRMNDNGLVYSNRSNYSNSLRPVINLKSDTVMIGTGTFDDPYVVK